MAKTTAMNLEVADRLRDAREALGYNNQAEFARMIGRTPQSYNTWETGLALPNKVEVLRRLCAALNVTADWLLFGNAPKPDVTREQLVAELDSLAGYYERFREHTERLQGTAKEPSEAIARARALIARVKAEG
jgi:transcriptional regulator with XRE-family HTH domain